MRFVNGKPIWSPVTEELRSAELPLRLWLSAKLPNVKPCFAEFRKAIRHSCIEPPTGLPTGTAGAAFDYLLRYRLGAEDPAELAVIGSALTDQKRDWTSTVVNLAAELRDIASVWKTSGQLDTSQPPTKLAEGCWALALFTELSRGVPFERSALRSLGSEVSTDALLMLAPRSGIDDLARLYLSSSKTLFPYLSGRRGTVVLGPTFGASIPGDADLIKGTTLVELKATVDRRRRDGTPRYSLDSRTLYQIVTYGLLGQNAFGLNEVAIFDARYSHLQRWSISELLCSLAGERVYVAELSMELDTFLRDPCGSRVPNLAREAAMRISAEGELPASRRRRDRFTRKPPAKTPPSPSKANLWRA
ncbi:hypothetical protein PICSAR132_00315 [Mycobacterium avium subsp. paratuberculosis]|nr:hypothetical protein PICSAR107_00129 [Mycobacterium avium subsp. paratuberculosis]CAG6859687.1 hypothetical protein PICSAR1_00604 [Mycobacterium avium subsp. paratuberculosis]CAG6863532.1 hypothetical protein PICSAR113_00794 [Mycobacterium avium subsp. paratuberculosis]CAG6863627.1 hypothetical protein PICSAR119_00785 [Mycobacterium avium subsp. paratuberculosis]CAG6871599.1 hypothetical protein PICSAR126_00945 [Mycobacterium avium subsp. paratuberculosis]